MVGQVTHMNCREFTNKKDIALHLKRKSANLTPKKTKKKSLRSNETFLIPWNDICFEEYESKKEKVVEKNEKMF